MTSQKLHQLSTSTTPTPALMLRLFLSGDTGGSGKEGVLYNSVTSMDLWGLHSWCTNATCMLSRSLLFHYSIIYGSPDKLKTWKYGILFILAQHLWLFNLASNVNFKIYKLFSASPLPQGVTTVVSATHFIWQIFTLNTFHLPSDKLIMQTNYPIIHSAYILFNFLNF